MTKSSGSSSSIFPSRVIPTGVSINDSQKEITFETLREKIEQKGGKLSIEKYQEQWLTTIFNQLLKEKDHCLTNLACLIDENCLIDALLDSEKNKNGGEEYTLKHPECGINMEKFGDGNQNTISPNETILVLSSENGKLHIQPYFANQSLKKYLIENKKNPITKKNIDQIFYQGKFGDLTLLEPTRTKLSLQEVEEIISNTVLLGRPDLKNKNLSGIIFPDNFDFRGANLTNTDLSNTTLVGANLSNTNLSGSDLFNANLSGAKIHLSKLRGANLHNTNLSDASISGSSLLGATILEANLAGIKIDAGTTLNGVRFSTQQVSQIVATPRNSFIGANLSDLDLRGVNFNKAFLNKVNFTNTNLSGANLSGSTMKFVNLTNADLTNVTSDVQNIVDIFQNVPAEKHSKIVTNPLVTSHFKNSKSWTKTKPPSPNPSLSENDDFELPCFLSSRSFAEATPNSVLLIRTTDTNGQKLYSFKTLHDLNQQPSTRGQQVNYDKIYKYNGTNAGKI